VLRSNGQIAFPEETEMRQLQTEKLRLEGVEVCHGRVKMKAFQWQP